MLVAEEPGAKLALRFEGRAVGILVVAGYDVGVLEYSVDDGPVRKLDQFTQWSRSLHIPWAYMLETELADGGHELVLGTSDSNNDASKGHAARIAKFLVN